MKVKGMKAVALLALLTFVFVQSASAQIVEALYFGASVIANKAIADSQRGIISYCELVFNVYLEPEGDGEPRYVNSWYPANGMAAWFGDRVILEVVPVKNGPPPRDLQVFLNHQPLKKKSRRVGKTGVEGGYPRLWVGTDLLIGANTLTVRFSSKEFATTVIQRADLSTFRRILADRNALTQLAGSAPTAFPSAPICSAIVDGKLEVFASPEEAQRALSARSAPSAPTATTKTLPEPTKAKKRPAKSKEPAKSKQAQSEEPRAKSPTRDVPSDPLAREAPAVEIRTGLYYLANDRPSDEGIKTVLDGLDPIGPDASCLEIPEGQALALLCWSAEPFQLTLEPLSGGQPTAHTVKQVKDGYEGLVRLVFGPSSPTCRFVIKQGDRQRVISFKKIATRRVVGGEQ